MTAKKSSSPEFDLQQWLNSQREYWDAWAKRGPSTDTTEASASWAEGLDKWWRAAGEATPEHAHPFFQQLLEQGKTYFHLAEQMRDDGPAADMDAWRKQLDKALTDATSASTGEKPPVPGIAALLALWDRPRMAWQQASESILGAGPNPTVGGKAPLEQYQEILERMLQFPGLGLGREWQAEAQESARLWLEHQRALEEYEAEFRHIALDSLTRLQQFVSTEQPAGKDVDSLRGLYDLWIDCGEAAYAERTATQDYAEKFARLVNSLLAFKKHQQKLFDRLARALNLPTSGDIDAMHHSLHDLRQEVADLKDSLFNGVKLAPTNDGARLKVKKKKKKRK